MKIIHSTVFFFKSCFCPLQLIFQIAVNFLATVSPGSVGSSPRYLGWMGQLKIDEKLKIVKDFIF